MDKYFSYICANMKRRYFLGSSAMAYAAIAGSSTIGLVSCKKENDIQSENIYSEAVVIGSGFGGSVAALRLGEAGVQTSIIEMGKQYNASLSENVFSPTFGPDTRASFDTTTFQMPIGPSLPLKGKRRYGVLDRNKCSSDNTMDIYRGVCLGGGSVVYGGMLPMPRIELWNKHFPDITYEEMANTWFPKVKSVIQMSIVPEDVLMSDFYQYSRVGLEQCERAGLSKVFLTCGFDFNLVRGEINKTVKRSTTNGEMIFGVNNTAKNSLDRNYLPSAVGTGNVKIYTLHKVDTVRQLSDEKYEVLVTETDEYGNRLSQKTFTCKYLFVTAGVVGTMNILLKAKHEGGLANLNDHVGKHWGNNGNTMVMRKIEGESGAKQCAIPITGYGNLDNSVAPLLAEQAPFPLGLELKALLTLSIVDSPERGYWEYNPSKDKAELKWNKAQHQISIDANKEFISKVLDTSGGSVDTSFVKNGGYTDDFTYHPLGGAVRGLASDNYGRLQGHKNLYSIDGSMIPGFTCCANPALTIAAIAERCMENILKEDIKI